MSNKADRTYVENVKDPDKVIPPSGNHVLIDLRVKGPGDYVPLTLFDDLPLDLGHGSAILASISRSLGVGIIGMAHAVSCPIALRTDWLSASNRVPFNPRSRA